jgi:hypothetical protein
MGKIWNNTINRFKGLNPISRKRRFEKVQHDELMRVLEERSHGICEICGKYTIDENGKYIGDPHHVLKKGAYPSHRYEPNICIYVCRKCHGWLENNPVAGEMLVARTCPDIWRNVVNAKKEINHHGKE